MGELRRVTFYVEEEDYKKLRAKLILSGLGSVSKWVRELIKRYLAQK